MKWPGQLKAWTGIGGGSMGLAGGSCTMMWMCGDARSAARVQDNDVMTKISTYFKKSIEELKCDDEDAFIKVLQQHLGK
jgi:hypothetical protein